MNLVKIFSVVILSSILFMTGRICLGQDAGLFSAGATRVSIRLGSGTAFNRDYSVVGAGVGRYVADGLEAGLEAESWSGSSPKISRITPGIQYVVLRGGSAYPYTGTFATRTFIESHHDTSTIGFRAGALFVTGRSAYLGVGLIHEIQIACDHGVYASCSSTYPELLLAFLF